MSFHVCLISCLVGVLHLILVATSLSLFSRLFMACSHLEVISLSECIFSWITLSHLSDHIRWAASVIRILISCTAALLGGFQFLLVALSLSCGRGRDIAPHPRIVPRDMLGQGNTVCGHSSLVFLHIILTALLLQSIRMWSMVSREWHVQHVCLSLYLGMCTQKGPIFCILCIVFKRNCLILTLMSGCWHQEKKNSLCNLHKVCNSYNLRDKSHLSRHW